MNIRRVEHSGALHVSFIFEARGRSRAETFDMHMDTHTAIDVAELNKKQKRFY